MKETDYEQAKHLMAKEKDLKREIRIWEELMTTTEELWPGHNMPNSTALARKNMFSEFRSQMIGGLNSELERVQKSFKEL